jgi:hypothetical protein
MTYTRMIQMAVQLAACGLAVVFSVREIILPFHKHVLTVSSLKMEASLLENFRKSLHHISHVIFQFIYIPCNFSVYLTQNLKSNLVK